VAASIKRDAGRRAGVFASFRRELLEPREEREIPLPGPPLFGLGVVGRPPLLEGPVAAVPRGDGVGRRGDQIRRQRRRAGVDQGQVAVGADEVAVEVAEDDGAGPGPPEYFPGLVRRQVRPAEARVVVEVARRGMDDQEVVAGAGRRSEERRVGREWGGRWAPRADREEW